MQQVLRPYATAGVALVGASIIAVTPVAAPLPEIQMRPVKLVDAWSELIANTTANYDSIVSGADSQAISEVFSQLTTDPSGVIGALSDLTPTVTTHLTSLPGTISVQLPPGLELAIAELGSTATTFNAISSVLPELTSNPYEALGTILNGYLNGQDNISLLNGAINIAGFNGILAPEQSVSIDLNLPDLLNALGLGNLSLSGLNLSNIANLGDLFSALNLSNDGLGTLLGNPTLSGLLGDLGLGNLGLGSLSLTNILSDLGLDGNVNLSDLSLSTVLGAFGIDGNVNLGLDSLLTDLGFGSLVNDSLGSLLATLPSGLLNGVVTDLNDVLGTLLGPLADNSVVATLLGTLGLNVNDLLSVSSLETALNGITVGDLLGGQTLDASIAQLLGDLGVTGIGSNLTIGGILGDLGFSSSTTDLTLSGLLSDLGLGDTGVTSLLNTVNLGTLLGDLGLSNLPLNLSDLTGLTDLTLSGLLGDLGLGNIAEVSVQPIGGLVTELVDTVPQQILTALGM